MGQAKLRGSKDDRIAEALVRKERERLERIRQEAEKQRQDREYLNSLPPEERQDVLKRRRVSRQRIVEISGLTTAMIDSTSKLLR